MQDEEEKLCLMIKFIFALDFSEFKSMSKTHKHANEHRKIVIFP